MHLLVFLTNFAHVINARNIERIKKTQQSFVSAEIRTPGQSQPVAIPTKIYGRTLRNGIKPLKFGQKLGHFERRW